MRIALLEPGSDGLALAALLRGAGFDVELGSIDQIIHLSADALVLAGDGPGALAALRALRDDGARPDMPVVLVGVPEGTPPRAPGPAFGADWAIARDDVDRELVSAVRGVVARTGPQSERPGLREHTLELSERSQVSAVHEGGARDQGAELGASEGDPPSGEIVVPGRHARTSDPALRPAALVDSASAEIAFDAEVSPALAALLLAADRRVFPHLPPIDPGLPRGEKSARELVPESLLWGAAAEQDEEPALEALTFVGAVPELSPSLREPAAPRTVGGEDAPRAPRVATPASRPSAHDTPTPAPRRRSVAPPSFEAAPPRPVAPAVRDASGEGDALSWIAALREQISSGVFHVELSAAGLASVGLSVRDGHVLAMEAPTAGATLAAVRGGSLDGGISDEDAEHELSRLRAAGLLSPLREARLRAAVRRDHLRALIAAPVVRHRIGPRAEGVPSSRVGRPFRSRLGPLLLELTAEVLDVRRVVAMLGGEGAEVRATGTYALLARECEVSPEIDALLATSRGERLVDLLASSWEEPTLPAAVALLGALGALEISVAPDGATPRAAPAASSTGMSIAAWLGALAQRAADADYFAILEVRRDASASEIAAAHARLSARLGALALPTLELGHLEPERRAATSAIEEAHRVLRVERWRDAYRRALVT